MEKNWITILSLTLIAIIFCIAALFMPWWSISASPEAKIVLNSNLKTDYNLFQTVTGTKMTTNNTESVTVPLWNLTEKPENSAPLSSALSVTLTLAVAGVGVSSLMMGMLVLSYFGKPLLRYAMWAGFIAAILLLLPPVSLTTTLPPAISKLSKLTPLDIPSTWASINPRDISGFWGAVKSASADFPSWAKGENFWIWGAESGWYLAFTAALLIALASLLIRYATVKKK